MMATKRHRRRKERASKRGVVGHVCPQRAGWASDRFSGALGQTRPTRAPDARRQTLSPIPHSPFPAAV